MDSLPNCDFWKLSNAEDEMPNVCYSDQFDSVRAGAEQLSAAWCGEAELDVHSGEKYGCYELSLNFFVTIEDGDDPAEVISRQLGRLHDVVKWQVEKT